MKKGNSSGKVDICKALSLSLLVDVCLSWLPLAPLLNLIGGFCGALYLQKLFVRSAEPLKTKHKRIFDLVGAAASALITAYIFTLLFIVLLGKPAQDEWFKFAAYEKITRHSGSFRWLFFLSSALVSFLSFWLGSFMAFKLRVSSPQPNDEKLLAHLPPEKLEEYLEEV